MAKRCAGKNCKFTPGFDVPHSPECVHRTHPVREPDNSCGPNNINVLNPNQADVAGLGSAEYMKLLVLAMYKLDVEEIVITGADIEECDGSNSPVICIANMEDGIHLKLISTEEARAIAKEEGGEAH